jgi:hypothetical protein
VLGERVEVAITCLPSPAVSERVPNASEGLLAGLNPGSTWIGVRRRIEEGTMARRAEPVPRGAQGGCHVTLTDIAFNHDPTSHVADALNIRVNAITPVTPPEWRAVHRFAQESPAAYALQETAGHTISIKARFTITPASRRTAEVRAEYGGLLGALDPQIVHFVRGVSSDGHGGQFVEFPLRNEVMHQLGGIRRQDCTWGWQYRCGPDEPWKPLAVTSHRIYVVLSASGAPWQQVPFAPANTQLPWTDVLDYACVWASLRTTHIDAAMAITERVYSLGPGLVMYDCPGLGSSHYSLGSFACTAFVDRLRGGFGNGEYVNCSDCATITSSFANILGCDLWQSQMFGQVPFDLNEILAIGSNTWETACGWGRFNYHEVAWTGACTAGNNVFDACLQVDGDADPTAPPHTALLPCNMPFGATGAGQYRDRLASPSGRPNCNPQPATRKHRPVV